MNAEWRPATAMPAAAFGEVHLWRFFTDGWDECLEQLADLLSADEADQAAGYRFESDRNRFILRRGLLRLILSGLSGVSPRRLVFKRLSAGKPVLEGPGDLEFNASDTRGMGLIGAARGAPLGIDVERIRLDQDHLRVAERFFSAAERRALQSLPQDRQGEAFFLAWTRKEAYIKALGGGLSLPLDQFDVALIPGEPARLNAARSGLPGRDEWQLLNLNVGPGYAGAICLPVGRWALWLWSLEPGRLAGLRVE